MDVTEINLVVRDLERSREFYEELGCALRPVTDQAGDINTAWLTDHAGPMPVSLHSEEFAAWWDRSEPRPEPGSTTIDITLAMPAEADALLDSVQRMGGRVIAPPRNMPWGQCYAIFVDPDGYRWGVKTEPRPE